jgi:hypothetical protein
MNSVIDIVKRSLNKITERDVSHTERLMHRASENATTKANALFIVKLLELIGDRLEIAMERLGSGRLLEIFKELDSGAISESTRGLIREGARQVSTSTTNLLPKEFMGDVTTLPGSPFWNAFLLILGLSPIYEDVLSKYFGDHGMLSLALLLKSIVEGEIDSSAVLFALGREFEEESP